MKFRFLLPLYLLMLAAPCVHANEFVRLDLNLFLTQENFLQTVVIELFDDRPLTRDNFLQYVDGGHYDDTYFHRLAYSGPTPFVLQGGGFYQQFQAEPAPINFSLSSAARVDLDGNLATPNPTVNNEFSNSPTRSNVKGTIAMAKLGGDPNSATNQFFFNLSNNSANLDNQNGGFTVFAQVVGNGMNLVDALTTVNPTSSIQIQNYNPDLINNTTGVSVPDGLRDNVGTFTTVPVLDLVSGVSTNDLLLRITRAERTQYFASGTTTQVPPTSFYFSEDSIIDAGAMFTQTVPTQGRVSINPNVTVETYDGASIGMALANSGHLRPGMQIGELTVGTFVQSSLGTTHVQLGGLVAGDAYDTIISNGNAHLAGALEVELMNTFLPEAGDSFTVLQAQGTIFDDFQDIGVPDLPEGLLWDYRKTTKTVTLSVVAPDFNSDGTVNAADYTVWRDALVSGSLDADANGDLQVNQTDYEIWRRFYGVVLPSASLPSSVSAPEPAAGILATLAGLAVAGRKRRSGGI